MKRTKVIALVLCAAIMLMGAGYAYWSDASIIESTVSTGKFEVGFTNVAMSADDYVNGGVGEPQAKATLSNDKNTVEIKVGNLYPGASARFDGTIKNDSTIPAVIKSVNVEYINVDADLARSLSVITNITHRDKDGNKKNVDKYKQEGRAWTSGKLIEPTSAYSLQTSLNKQLVGIRLEPSETLSFDIMDDEVRAEIESLIPDFPKDENCMIFLFGAAATNAEDMGAHFKVTINWAQHNDI